MSYTSGAYHRKSNNDKYTSQSQYPVIVPAFTSKNKKRREYTDEYDRPFEMSMDSGATVQELEEKQKKLGNTVSGHTTWLTIKTIIVFGTVLSVGVLFGLWGWNRASINNNNGDISSLEKFDKLLSIDTVYVDPILGNDNNIGTANKPVATIIRAGQLVKNVEPSYIFLSEGTHDLGDVTPFLLSNMSLLSGTIVKGSNVTILNTTIVSRTQDPLYIHSTVLEVSTILVPGAHVNQRIFADTSTGLSGSGLIIANNVTSVTIVGTMNFIPVSDFGRTVRIYELTSKIIFEGVLSLTGSSTNVFDEIIIETGLIRAGVDGGRVVITKCNFIGRNDSSDLTSSIEVIRAGELSISSTLFFNVSIFRSFSNGNTKIIGSVFERSSGFDGTSINLQEQTVEIAGVILNSDRTHFLINCLINQLTQMSINGDSAIIMRKSIGELSRIEYTSESKIGLQIQDGSIITLQSNNRIFSSSNGGAIVVFDGGHLLIDGSLIIETNNTSTEGISSSSSSLTILNDITFIGPFEQTIVAFSSEVLFKNSDISLDGSNDGNTSPRMIFRNSDVRMQSSSIAMVNITRGIIMSTSRFSMELSTITISSSENSINIDDTSFLAINQASLIDITCTSTIQSCVCVDKMSKMLSDGELSTAALIVNATGHSCIEIKQDSTFVQFSSSDLSLFCDDFEFDIVDSSKVIIVRNAGGTNVVLEAGTVDLTRTEGVVNATSVLIATPGTTYIQDASSFRYSL